MTLPLTDSSRDALKHEGWLLLEQTSAHLESMRVSLQDDAWLAALEERDRARPLIERLASLLEAPRLPACLSRKDSDPAGMQRFRRAALLDLECLRALFAAACANAWRSASDEAQGAAVRAAGRRWATGLALAVIVLACLWGWQRHREASALAEVNAAKALMARQSVELIGLAARLAVRTQGKPLEEIAPDMSGACSGIDVRLTLPNHPCREAWAANSQALYHAAIPAPGAPVDCPSELFFDPWGAPYLLFKIPRGGWRVFSAGPDGLPGTPDDVFEDIPAS